jgi:hypothetical protein
MRRSRPCIRLETPKEDVDTPDPLPFSNPNPTLGVEAQNRTRQIMARCQCPEYQISNQSINQLINQPVSPTRSYPDPNRFG